MKNTRGLLALLLVFIMVAQIGILGVSAVTVDSNGQPTKYSTEYNSGTRNVIANTLKGTSAASYYTGNYTYDKLAAQSGNTLYTSLHNLMTDTHSYKSTYDDCHFKADQTDCENENGMVSLIYTGYSATMSQWNGWNREHVWPKNLGGNNDKDYGGGADMHHIRPSDAVVNSTRSNSKYGYASSGSKVYGRNPASGYLGGTSNNTYFEPKDNVKGDVARICLYVHVRWGSAWGASDITKVFQSIDVLLEWCELDPVDTWELGRNEVIGAIQGNRNVFIDYPELAWKLFNREVPENMPSPSAGNTTGATSPTSATEESTEATTAPTTPSVDPSVTGSATIAFDNVAYRTSVSTEQQIWQQNGITVTNSKASSTQNINSTYYNPVRIYAHTSLTIQAPGMTKIEFKLNSAKPSSGLTNSVSVGGNILSCTASNYVVTIKFAEPVDIFEIEDVSAQFQIDSLTVYVATTGSDDPGNDNPGTDNPGTDNPGTDNPGTDNPGTDNPGTDNPGTDNPGTDNPGTDNPGTDNPGTSDSKEEPTGFMAWLLGIINAILALFGLKMVI